MNEKKAKALRRTASAMAGGVYDEKKIYKLLKKIERNRDATMARLKSTANKSMDCTEAILEGGYDT